MGPPSRRLFEQGDEDEEEERSASSSSRRPRDERVEGFANGKALGYVPRRIQTDAHTDMCSGDKPKGPLIIPSLPNRDWKEAARKAPSYRPQARQPTAEDLITHERTGDGPQRSGLRRIVKEEVKVEAGEIKAKTEETVHGISGSTSSTTEFRIKDEPLSLEEQALRALLAGNDNKESEEEKARNDLIIGMQENKLNLSEQDAFKRDMQTLPQEVSVDPLIQSSRAGHKWNAHEQSTTEDYENIPVEAFGLAMVRGMGWDPKAKQGTAVHEPKVRPQLLGLGATPMDPTIRPTHAKSGQKKDRVAERNAKSGRGFIATSLLVKKEREGSGTPNGSSRAVSPSSDGKRRREGEDERDVKRERGDRDRDDYRDRERERERDRDRDRARDGDRRREREYETEEQRARRKAREREMDYETEEERARRKAKERADRDRDRDRNGDRRYDERDRERDRDRDQDRRR